MRRWLAFGLSLALVLGGALLAHGVQTAGGVSVREARAPADQGVTITGLLYTPPNAKAATPAPAVLLSHGYINTREMQSPFAIELSRRGYVVLAMDMTGHGGSGGNVGALGFGGPAALAYLKGLPFVDPKRVSMAGHSMGGNPILAAAKGDPDGYRSLVLVGSTMGLLGAPAPERPRNLGVVFGQYDEFAGLMWGVAEGGEVGTSKKLMALFGETAPVEPGRVYGDIAAGTARWLSVPPITHPWEHFSGSGVGLTVDWIQRTLPAPRPLDPSDQIWGWKEAGTALSFMGFFWLIITTFDLLLETRAFARLNQPAEPVAERRDGRWWLDVAITAALPALTYFPLMKVGQIFFPMPAFPQWVQNQLLVWALGTALITLLIGVVLRRKAVFSTRWGLSLGVAVVVMAVAYASLALVEAVFKVDYRVWVLGLKPLTPDRAVTALPYLALWTLFFLVAIRALAANIAVKGEGLISQIGWAKAAMSLGFLGLVAWQYATLFATGRLATPTEPLNVIIAIQFIPLLAMVGVIGAWTYRRTNSFAPGAFICALLVTWYVTSGTANHRAPGFEPQIPGAARAR